MSALENVEAEQALLGAILLENDVLPRVASVVRATDFYEALHGRIFEIAADRINRGELASPVTLRHVLDGDEALAQVGGPKYLARLAGAAVSLFAAKDYAVVVAECAKRRRLAALLDKARADLEDPERDAAAVMGGIDAQRLIEDTRGSKDVISFAQAVTDASLEVSNALSGEGPQPMRSGVQGLDDMLGGFYKGDLVILAGRPGMGKSSVALSFSLDAARAGQGVAFASLEMKPSAMALRAVSEATERAGAGVAYADARRGIMSEREHERWVRAQAAIAGLPIKIIPPTTRDLGGLFAAGRRCKQQFEAAGVPMAALVIDYLQLIQSPARSRYDQVSEISMGLKQMALTLDVPVIALSQLSRAVESRDDKRPVMSDLRESGQLEQDADAILFCFRREYYLRQERPEEHEHEAMMDWHAALSKCAGWLDIIVAKQRMGATGTVAVRFDETTNTLFGGRH